jgi:hypothetical protein
MDPARIFGQVGYAGVRTKGMEALRAGSTMAAQRSRCPMISP